MRKISKEALLLVINHTNRYNKDEYDAIDFEDLLYVYGDYYDIRGKLIEKSESMKILRDRVSSRE